MLSNIFLTSFLILTISFCVIGNNQESKNESKQSEIIQKQLELVDKIFALIEQSQFYIEQVEALSIKKESVDENIIKWEEYYKSLDKNTGHRLLPVSEYRRNQ